MCFSVLSVTPWLFSTLRFWDRLLICLGFRFPPLRFPLSIKRPLANPQSFCQARRNTQQARVAELADAHGSGPCPRKWVEVQILSRVLQEEVESPATRVKSQANEPTALSFLSLDSGHSSLD